MDAVDRQVKEIVGTAVVHAYGLPGHLRPCRWCGELYEDCRCYDEDEEGAASADASVRASDSGEMREVA